MTILLAKPLYPVWCPFMALFFFLGLLRFFGIQSCIQIGYKAQEKAWEKYIFQVSQSIFFNFRKIYYASSVRSEELVIKNWAVAVQNVVAKKLAPVSSKACGKVSPISRNTPFDL
jgi:hypothetical protein